ncbi:MAG: DegV family protein [Bacillota bacterium]
MKTAIITDSAANLDEQFLEAHENLYMLPLLIMIDGESFRDQVEISSESVYDKLDSHQVSTSLPSTEDLYNLLDQLKAEGYTDVLALNLSSGLSGTFNAFNLVFKDYEGLTITHYDSKTLGGGLAYLVEHAVGRIGEGIKPEDVIKELDTIRFKESIALFTIDTLKYLRRGGRIGKVEGTLGEALHVKPVITVNDDGVYVTKKKSIGSLQRALLNMKKILVKRFGDTTIDLTIHYGNNLEKAKDMAEKLKSILNIRHLTLSQLTPVLGIHTGPRMFAYIAKKA